MPGQQPGMDGSAVVLLHRLSGTFPTLTTAGCCPSAAGCRATVCGASRRTTPATSGYWAGPLEGEWTSPLGQDTSDERMSSWERSTDSRPNGLVEDSARNSSATRSSWSAAVVDRSLRSLVSL